MAWQHSYAWLSSYDLAEEERRPGWELGRKVLATTRRDTRVVEQEGPASARAESGPSLPPTDTPGRGQGDR